jgi:hypothetical protein
MRVHSPSNIREFMDARIELRGEVKLALGLLSQTEQSLSSPHEHSISGADLRLRPQLCMRRSRIFSAVKHEHENQLARVLDVVPPQPYERGAAASAPGGAEPLSCSGPSGANTTMGSREKTSPNTASKRSARSSPSPTPSGTSDCECRVWRTWPRASL